MWFPTEACVVTGLVVVLVGAPVAAGPLSGPPAHAASGPTAGAAADGDHVPSPVHAGDAACARSDPIRFGRRHYVEQRGDVAPVTVLFDEGFSDDTIALYVRGDDDRYDASVDVTDGNGDARVTLLFDTGAAGSDRPDESLRVAAAADEVVDREETAPDGPLTAGDYDLTAWGPGCAQGHADLVVEGGGPVAVTAYRGDRSLLDDLTTAAAVREALAVGDLRKTYGREPLADREGVPVLRGETLVLAVESPELADRVAAAGGSTAGDLRPAVDDALTVSVTEARSSVDRSELGDRYDLAAFGDWRAVAEPTGDTVYLLVDTRAPFAPDDERADYGRVGERYVVTAETADGTGTTAFEFAEPTAALDLSAVSEAVVVRATADATVTGTTDLPDGTAVTVALRGSGGPFPANRTVTVEDGRFAAAFDLAGVSGGTQFQAVVRYGGAVLDRDAGRVLAAPRTATPTVTAVPPPTTSPPTTSPATTTSPTTTRPATATTPAGGPVPGPGAAGAVLALLGATLLSLRRRPG